MKAWIGWWNASAIGGVPERKHGAGGGPVDRNPLAQNLFSVPAHDGRYNQGVHLVDRQVGLARNEDDGLLGDGQRTVHGRRSVAAAGACSVEHPRARRR